VKINTKDIRQREIAKGYGIMQSMLYRFNIFAIQIVFTVIAEAPDDAHKRVDIFQRVKFFATYPTIIRFAFARYDIAKEYGHGRNVVKMIVTIAMLFNSCMGDSTTTTKEVVEMMGCRQTTYNPLCYFVFATHIR
jgi:hypothetical protein